MTAVVTEYVCKEIANALKDSQEKSVTLPMSVLARMEDNV